MKYLLATMSLVLLNFANPNAMAFQIYLNNVSGYEGNLSVQIGSCSGSNEPNKWQDHVINGTGVIPLPCPISLSNPRTTKYVFTIGDGSGRSCSIEDSESTVDYITSNNIRYAKLIIESTGNELTPCKLEPEYFN